VAKLPARLIAAGDLRDALHPNAAKGVIFWQHCANRARGDIALIAEVKKGLAIRRRDLPGL